MADAINIFVCGDVMTGRGIDQILRFPGNPVLYESYVHDAREYVRLAEAMHGAIARPADDAYIWGDALIELQRQAPDLRLINLETSITTADRPWPAKAVHYRMHPQNIGCITAAGINCCVLANNHVMDWGHAGLLETLAVLQSAAVPYAGAGRDAQQARAPAILDLPHKGRALVFAFGLENSGIPSAWAARPDHPGVNLLADLSLPTAQSIGDHIQRTRHPGDIVIVSIHWGSNWGYTIPPEQRLFAHQLIDCGVDLIHGHSSHHVKAVELYRRRIILYGCGDFITDYEGIERVQPFRGDLSLMYFAQLDRDPTRPARLRLVPVQMQRFRLTRASDADTHWLCQRLNIESNPLGTHLHVQADASLWASSA